MAHYVVICGGRDYSDADWLFRVVELLTWLYEDELRIIHGGYSGADTLAANAAAKFGVRCKAFAADWATHGTKAGPLRNQAMADYLVMCRGRGHTVQIVAFPGGSGTVGMMVEGQARSIPVARL